MESCALARACALSAKGETLAEVSSAAYVAKTQARAALALAQAKRNEAAIQSAELERAKGRADAEAQQAERARSMAIASRADPIADNANTTSRAWNRRVEVYISQNSQPVRPRS